MTTYIEAATAVATAVGGLIVALIVVLSRIHSQSQATLAQVSNDHGTNLRDDIDDTRRAIEYLTAEHCRTAELLTGLATDMREVRSSVARLDSNANDTHRDLDRRLRSLERSSDNE